MRELILLTVNKILFSDFLPLFGFIIFLKLCSTKFSQEKELTPQNLNQLLNMKFIEN